MEQLFARFCFLHLQYGACGKFLAKAMGQKDSCGWLHEFAREVQAVMRSEGYFARCTARRDASTAGWTDRCRVCCQTGEAELKKKKSSPSKIDTHFSCFAKGPFWYTS